MSELGRGWPGGPVPDSVQGPDAAGGQVRGVRFTEPRGWKREASDDTGPGGL